MNDSHEHEHKHTPPPENGVEDVGSRALSEALGSSFFFVKIVMIVLVLVFFASGAVTVGPQERAVILRFGKPRGTGQAQLLGPGLHLAWPPPIDEVVKIPIGQIQTVRSTIGWFLTPEQEAKGEIPPPRSSLNPSSDGYTLTGDGNIVHARATLGYRVTDALAYVFNFVNGSNNVQTALDSALTWASSRMSVDDAIKNNDAFKENVSRRMAALVDQMNLGITIDTLTVNVVPPRALQGDFDAVTGAESDRNKALLAAQGEANALLAGARAESNTIVSVGQSAANADLKALQSFAKAFSQQLPEYKKNPELFHQRLMTETWGRVMANAREKWYMNDATNGSAPQLWLQLNREPEKARTNAPAGTGS